MKIAVWAPGAPVHGENFVKTCKPKGHELKSVRPDLGALGEISEGGFHCVWIMGLFPPIDLYLEPLQKMGKGIIIHWIGTDILLAQQVVQNRPSFRKYIGENTDLHVYDNINFGPELGLGCGRIEKMPEHRAIDGLGLNAYWVPHIPPETLTPLEDLDGVDKKIISVYCPLRRADFFGLKTLATLAGDMPEVEFRVYSNFPDEFGQKITADNKPLTNVIFMGCRNKWQKRNAWGHAKLFLNLAPHGGFGITAIEHCQLGVPCLTRETMPYCHTINQDYEKAKEQIQILLDKPTPDLELSRHYRRIYTSKRQSELAGRAINQMIEHLGSLEKNESAL